MPVASRSPYGMPGFELPPPHTAGKPPIIKNEAKRRALWVEHVLQDVLPQQCAHRMAVFTVPKCIRPTLMRNRFLLGLVSRTAYERTQRFLSAQLPACKGRCFFVASIQLWGSAVNMHPHIHAIVSLALKARGGALHPLPEDLDFSPLAEDFRRATLRALRRREAISRHLADKVLSWDHHGGFSVDASVKVPPGDREGLERVAAYVLRPPVSLSRLTYRSGSRTVIYQTPHTPLTNANFVTLDAKAFIVRLLVLVPQRYQSLIRYYGAASSTWRRGPPARPFVAEVEPMAPLPDGPPPAPQRKRRSWARLIKRVYGVDPLRCSRCGSPMEIIAFITQDDEIERILRHLNRWDPPTRPCLKSHTSIATAYEDLPGYEKIFEPP